MNRSRKSRAVRYPAIPLREFARLVEIVRQLRHECPWDREQTHRSIRHSLLEEAYEAVEAMDGGDMDHLRSELGDILLHVVMHSTIAEKDGEFTLREVIEGLSGKLIRRHPHVFGKRRAMTAREVKGAWERLKMEEGRKSALDGVPHALPSLQRAERVQEKASKTGFDWKVRARVWDKVEEELAEVRRAVRSGKQARREEEFGDLLFALVNYARFIGVHPENALRATIAKFERRFRFIEEGFRARGKKVHGASLREMDRLWKEAKARGL